MKFKIPLFKIYYDREDIKVVKKVIRRGTYWAVGPEIEKFEKRIAKFIGTKYALTFNSGTSALHSLLLAYNIKGKEVIVPSFTFIATANTVLLAGGKPVFAESESDTFGLDAEDVKKRITKKTKAILALHYGGFPSRDIEKLRELADKNNLLLIEDAAESLGANVNGKKVGTFGHSAMFSFCQNKVITTGEGGVIVTDSKEIYQKAKLIRSHGRVEISEGYFSSIGDNDYVQVGYNYRMPTVLAALGISQLKKIKKVIKLRRNKAFYFHKHLSEIKEIKIPLEPSGSFSVYQMYTIQLPNQEIRNALQNFLSEKRIASKVYFNPIHLKTIFKKNYKYKKGDLPKTETLSKKVLTLPIYPTIKKRELKYITKSIENFFKSQNEKSFQK